MNSDTKDTIVNVAAGTGLAAIGGGLGWQFAGMLALNPIGGAIVGGLALLGLVAGTALKEDDD